MTPPTPFESEGCSGVSSGEITSTELPDGKLPEDPSKVWLCEASTAGVQGAVGPLEPLALPELVADAVFAYNISCGTDFDPVCLDEPGPEYSVVHEYADATTYAVAVQVLGCDVISAGGQVKEGGQAYVDKLLGLWREQRAVSPSAQSRSGPLCPQLSLVFAIDPREAEFTSGQACVGWEFAQGGYVGPTDEVPLPATVLAELPAQMATATNEIPGGRPIGGGMVLLTRLPRATLCRCSAVIPGCTTGTATMGNSGSSPPPARWPTSWRKSSVADRRSSSQFLQSSIARRETFGATMGG